MDRNLPSILLKLPYIENNRKNEGTMPSRKSSFRKEIYFIVPEYNAHFPGILKTFIDGMTYPEYFRKKKARCMESPLGVGGRVASR